jgi:dephospho-CoA kinase
MTMLPPIVTIHGLSCSGKSTAGEFFRSKGWIWLEASDYLNDLLSEHGLGRSLEIKLDFFREHGPRIVAERIAKNLQQDKHYCITGLRMPEELRCLNECSAVTAVYLESTLETRFERAAQRFRADVPKSVEEFESLSDWERSLGLTKLREACDVILQNDESVESFNLKLGQLV